MPTFIEICKEGRNEGKGRDRTGRDRKGRDETGREGMGREGRIE